MSTQHTNSSEWPGAFAAFSTALDRLSKNLAPVIFTAVLYVILSIISNELLKDDNTATKTSNLGDLLYLLFLVPITIYGLALAKDKKVTLNDFFNFSVFKFLSAVAAAILLVFILGGSLILFVIPVIWTLAWFYLTIYAIVDKNLGPIKGLAESKRISENHKGKVWGVFGVYILFSIPCVILAAIFPIAGNVASLVVTFWGTIVGAMLYNWLLHHHKA